MARVIPTDTYASVLEAIARFPDGAGIEQIEKNLSAPPNRRTLQRWLNTLIAQKQVHRAGQGRAVKYRRRIVADAEVNVTGKATVTAYAELSISLSLEAKEVESHVRRPMGQRTPVGYNRAFLDEYRPNETRYLSQETSDELLSQGQAVNSNDPAGTYARHQR